MGRFIRGTVVVVPFPFSDLQGSKRRPALVIASLGGSDVILCQITSQNSSDTHSILILNSDFANGSLNKDSYVRPGKIFTADANIIIKQAGILKSSKTEEIISKIVEIITK